MNGQKKNYDKYREVINREQPVTLEKKIDLRGLLAYADKKGVRIKDLSIQEQKKFVI